MKENLKIKVIIYETDGLHHFIEKKFEIKNKSISDFLVEIESVKNKFNPYATH